MNDTIPVRFIHRCAQQAERVAMRLFDPRGEKREITWGQWGDRTFEFAAAVLESRARDTSAVAILAGNGFMWPIADLGTLICGKQSVGIYPTSAPVQIEKMLADSAAGVLVIDDAARLAAVLEMRSRLPALHVIVASCNPCPSGVVSWNEWLEIGAAALASNVSLARSIETTARAIDRKQPAIIIYTSGSTGEPKGAVLSHGCIEASTASIEEALGLREGDSTLSFLPYSHAAERITGLYMRIRCGIEADLLQDPSQMWHAALSCKPTMFGGLPRYYEKLHHTAVARGRSAAGLLGGRVRLATSGGAALSPALAEALAKDGVTVLGAYGLTEHLCVAFNRPDDPTFDTAGAPMPGTQIRIAPDGEVLIRRSELTFSGYHNLPEATDAAFTDDGEWLYTGDLGSLDDRGRLRITGRKKELLALSNGKMVAPLPIEARLSAHPLIAHAVLHAEGKQFVSALIVLRGEAVERWAEKNAISLLVPLVSHPLLVAEVQKAVDDVNAGLSRAESIRRFVLVDCETTIELTPTQKIRRSVMLEKYSAELEALYA
ncbi:MAG TPA: long-chain fatty acid--CoA ligase [Steroidobacteraceae bacterium]|nr:long-chain fatty acid--CoA ligase [Steroidobacteraceae bacterium]